MKKLYSVASVLAAVFLFLILVSSTASASITETRITTSGTASNPAIYGNRIVWDDTLGGISAIYALDLSTKKKIQITTRGKASNPAIYGNKIVCR
jgi:beta propeller repeat protein